MDFSDENEDILEERTANCSHVRGQRIAQQHCKNHMKIVILVYRIHCLLRFFSKNDPQKRDRKRGGFRGRCRDGNSVSKCII